jgi:hypothetical protein
MVERKAPEELYCFRTSPIVSILDTGAHLLERSVEKKTYMNNLDKGDPVQLH